MPVTRIFWGVTVGNRVISSKTPCGVTPKSVYDMQILSNHSQKILGRRVLVGINVKVGTAPDNWGVWFPSDPKQIPWQRFLDEVVLADYKWIELGPPGYLPFKPE